MRRLLVPVAVLLFALPLLAGRERPSAAIPLTPLRIEEAYGRQIYPSVASDGETFFAVWADYRNSSTNPDIMGARISATGEVLDRFGILIAARQASWISGPTITWTAAGYRIFWWDENATIVGTVVSSEGRILDERKLVYRPSYAGGGLHAVTAHGVTLLLVNDVIVRIGQDGTGVYAAAFSSTEGVAATPSGFVVFNALPACRGCGRFDLYANVLDARGKQLKTKLALKNFYSFDYRIETATIANRILAVWRNGASITIAEFDDSGASVGEPIQVANAVSPQVVSTETEFIVTWSEATDADGDGFDEYLMRFDASGAPLDSAPVPFAHPRDIEHGEHFASAAAATRGLVVYDVGVASQNGAVRGFTFPDGAGIEISEAPTIQAGVDAASTDDTTLIAWTEVGSETELVRARRLRNDGTLLDTDGIDVGAAMTPSPVAVTAGSDEFLVAWSTSGNVVAQRVSSAGVLLDAPVVVDHGKMPAGAFDGEWYAVVYLSDYGNVMSRRLRPDRTLTYPATLRTWDAFPETRVDRLTIRAEEGSYALLVSHADPGCHIPECPPVEPSSIEIDQLDSEAATATRLLRWNVDARDPGATFSTTNGMSLVVWSAADGLKGRRFDKEWTPLDPEGGFVIGSGTTRDAHVARFASGWVVTFSEDQSTSSVLRESLVTVDGAVDQLPSIATAPLDRGSDLPGPTIVPIVLSGNRLLAVFDALDPQLSVRRLFIRSLRAWRAQLIR